MTQSISVSKFKARCLELFREVKRTGRSITITKNGEPIAMLTPIPPDVADRSAFGAMRNVTQVRGDILEPLDEKDWDVLAE